ncbi:secondary thiamine-phosphate synthase enzyme [Sphingomonas jinjuensis]|uniref:Secondary thiamine-phosphate synthase enzyme n=1 Tax=Sphingomonas jinjuensis TaxID=535907 RepID=A0A840F5K7_9SPHN|nr:secondary thiamine-phosphate synthase enzyme YjbQ [Sphingomonas jinjuensis]MBB4153069.1 secondary thiamine-phosphate synthase enzyme [Sphingomonas jinjuensis]
MKQASDSIIIDTRGIGLVEVTRPIVDWLAAQQITQGLLTIFCRHTSASLLIQENAAPAVKRDLARFFAELVREDAGYEHDDEGLDDMPAHIRSALTNVSLSIPVVSGAAVLGTWQGIYLFEHRRAPHRRTLALHVVGE